MTTPDHIITPPHWRNLYSPKIRQDFETVIADLREEFMMEGYDVFFQLWGANDYRGGNNNGRVTFCSMGIRKSGKQENGNNYSILYAFGFYHEDLLLWPDNYVYTIVERAAERYTKFLDGEWSPKDMNIYFNEDYIQKTTPPSKVVIDWAALEEDDEDYDPLS